MDDDISFASFGLVVLDEIRFPNRKPLTNVLGGSGAYGLFYLLIYQYLLEDSQIPNIPLATLGARLFLPSPQSRSIVWPINIGNDFPEPITKLLQSWNTQLVVKQALDQPSTRGLLEYQDTTFGRTKGTPFPSALCITYGMS
jgi:hypothetical protein